MDMGASMKMGRHSRRAFTLVELLVVIAIVGLLAALLMPGLSAAWQMALVTGCRRHLKTIWDAQSTWRAENGSGLLLGGADWEWQLGPYLEDASETLRCPATGRTGGGRGGGRVLGMHMEMRLINQGTNELEYAVVFGSQWTRRTYMGGKWLVELEDEGWSKQQRDYEDLRMFIYYEGGVPHAIEPLKGASGSRGHFRYDFYVNGQLVVRDWESLEEKGLIRLPLGTVSHSDYGLSKGTYDIAERNVTGVDGRLYFILDYARAVADYNQDSMEDEWDKFFIEDPQAWLVKYDTEGTGDWQEWQALRHMGKANVLYCDGRVELVGPEDLYPMDGRWYWHMHDR